MSANRSASNAVLYAVEKVLDLYGVQHTREQSRVVQVEGAAGRWRPMYFGRWVDDFGKAHSSGRADILARPRIGLRAIGNDLLRRAQIPCTTETLEWMDCRVATPLWIECKSGKGRLSHDQIAFKSWVESNGDYFLLIHDDVSPLIDWLTRFGVAKEPKNIVHAEPMDLAAVEQLPCRHCHELKTNHDGTILACKALIGVGMVASKKLIGKVYSPDLKVKN